MATIIENGSIQNSAHGERLEAFQDILVTWSAPLVLLIMIPFAIYLPNQNEFNYDISVMAPFFLLMGIATILSFVLYYANPVWRTRIALLSFYLSIYLVLADIFTPNPGELLDGRLSELPRPWYNTVIQFFFILILLLLGRKSPIKLQRNFAAILVGVFCVSQAIMICYNLNAETVWGTNRKTSNFERTLTRPPNAPIDKPNIYHIMLDGYSSYSFTEEIKKSDVTPIFEGFTFFQRNRSNYFVTMSALPCLLTGTLYQRGSFRKWQESAFQSGIFDELRKVGYVNTVYTGWEERLYRNVDYKITSSNVAQKQETYNSDILVIRHAWLTRIAGKFLMKTAHDIFRSKPQKNSVMATPIIKEFINGERSRTPHGNYVFCHFMIPHPPFVWDENCNLCPETSYMAQVACVTKLLKEFFELLKKLNRYEGSMIIIQGDHGWDDVGPLQEPAESPPLDVMSMFMKYKYFKPEGYLNLAHSLLLIKPPFSQAVPLQISDAPTQSMDAPATICDQIGIKWDTQGQSVFTLNDAESREIHHFLGFYNKDAKGKILEVGRNVAATKIGHFSFTNGIGWKVYPDLDLVY